MTIYSTSKKLTFAKVYCPDEYWRWAIVTQYVSGQNYGHIVCAFSDEFLPETDAATIAMMDAMEKFYK
jgi:hypothetical protein